MFGMNSPFGGFRHRRRNRELPLAEYPEWGLDILRGLYGCETVDRIVAEQQTCEIAASPGRATPDGSSSAHSAQSGLGRGVPFDTRRLDDAEPGSRRSERGAESAHTNSAQINRSRDDDAPVPPEILTPMLAEIEAINALLRWLKRTFARH